MAFLLIGYGGLAFCAQQAAQRRFTTIDIATITASAQA